MAPSEHTGMGTGMGTNTGLDALADRRVEHVTLTLADTPEVLKLSDEAGWNQTAEDWAVFITAGHAIGCRVDDGELVATAAALPCGNGHGWVSMVLVTPAWRHRGLATLLLDHCIGFLRDRGLTPVLDATPDGAAVYRRIGFVPGFEFERWEADARRPSPAVVSPSNGVNAAGPHDAAAITALDSAATRTSRAFLLDAMLRRDGTRAWRTAAGDGFAIVRNGRRARHIGPLVATDDAQAISLLEAALAGEDSRVFIDVPVPCRALAQSLQTHGFRRQRPFTRMALGTSGLLARGERVYALAGPEFG